MKRMKKVLSIILTFVMVLTMAVPSFAATITVKNAVNNETYTAYKIFDVTKTSKTSDKSGYAYSIKSDSPWKSTVENYKYHDAKIFTLTPAVNDSAVLVVTVSESFDEAAAADFARELAEANVTDNTKRTATANNGKVEFSDLDAGYYFVTTSVGALCALNTTDELEIEEKNSIPSLTKIEDKEAAAIGDEITYTITVKDGIGTDNAIIVYDYMESGLTLESDSFSIKVNNSDVATANYKLDTTSGTVIEGDETVFYTFKITLNADYVATLDENDTIVITYKARLNQYAEISDDVNTNKAWLHYSKQITTPVPVDVATYKFDIIKTDSNSKLLTGAKFELYDAQTNGSKIDLVLDSGVYRVADATEKGSDGFESAEIEAGKVTIKGLNKTTYWLEETVAPAGYNKLTSRIQVDLTSGNLVTSMSGDTWSANDGGVRIINKTGAQLPSTGGIGTTVFYVVGIVLMAGAVFFVVRRKRA